MDVTMNIYGAQINFTMREIKLQRIPNKEEWGHLVEILLQWDPQWEAGRWTLAFQTERMGVLYNFLSHNCVPGIGSLFDNVRVVTQTSYDGSRMQFRQALLDAYTTAFPPLVDCTPRVYRGLGRDRWMGICQTLVWGGLIAYPEKVRALIPKVVAQDGDLLAERVLAKAIQGVPALWALVLDPPADAPPTQMRVLRLVEFIGTPEAVTRQLANSQWGQREGVDGVVIRAATLPGELTTRQQMSDPLPQ